MMMTYGNGLVVNSPAIRGLVVEYDLFPPPTYGHAVGCSVHAPIESELSWALLRVHELINGLIF